MRRMSALCHNFGDSTWPTHCSRESPVVDHDSAPIAAAVKKPPSHWEVGYALMMVWVTAEPPPCAVTRTDAKAAPDGVLVSLVKTPAPVLRTGDGCHVLPSS